MSRTARAWGNLLLALLLSGVGSQAHAQLAVAAPSCEGLDPSTLHARIELEIGEVAAEWQARSTPVVLLGCADDRVRIEITDPVTDKSVARTIAMPAVDRERVLGLAIAQLFLTSWLELLLPAPSLAQLPAPPPGGYAAIARRAREAISVSEPSPPPPHVLSRTIGLSVLGGLGVRDVEAPVLTQALALRAQVALDRTWALTIAVGLEHGVASRERGGVELWLGDVGLGADLTLVRDGALTIGLGAHGGVVWSRLAGQPSRNDVRGDSAEGVGARIALAPRVGLELDGFVISLAVEAGVDLGLPIGLVKDERAVTAGGFFGRALLGVGVRFGD